MDNTDDGTDLNWVTPPPPSAPPTAPQSQWAEPPLPEKRRSRALMVAIIVGAFLVLAGVGAFAITAVFGGTDKDDAYMKKLDEARLTSEFSSKSNAVAKAHAVCRSLEEGGDQRGSEADKIAVSVYCKKFLDGYRVLENQHVRGTFTLFDSDLSDSCIGSGGYSDIHGGTEVLLKGDEGTVLAQTELNPGIGGFYKCTYSFEFDATEGEDSYAVSVSHRGEIHFTWDQLKAGPELSLGSD